MSDKIMVRTTETYTLTGPQTVDTAWKLLDIMPSGRTLKSLTYSDAGTWVAVVESGPVPL